MHSTTYINIYSTINTFQLNIAVSEIFLILGSFDILLVEVPGPEPETSTLQRMHSATELWLPPCMEQLIIHYDSNQGLLLPELAFW